MNLASMLGSIVTARRLVVCGVAASAFAVATWADRDSRAPAAVNATPATTQSAEEVSPLDHQLIRVAEPHMLVISIDGLRPDCLLRADAPNIRSLMARGSFTFYARTTDVAITTPSHVSMMTGVTPERHGIDFNGDPPDDAMIRVPSLFDFAHDAGLSTGMASGKRKFTLFTRTHHVDFVSLAKETAGPDAPVGDAAADIIRDHKPRLMFVHFPGADVAGHAIGWGTPQQIAAISKIDQSVGEVLRAYDSAGLAGSTYIILSADHGGTARSHGRDDVRSRYIPWIFVGPGVRANFDLTRLGKGYDIATYDTFATACYVLGLPVPSDSDGKPILAAFEDYDLMSAAPATKPATTPTTTPVK